MTGEPTHATSEMVPRAPAISIITTVWKVKYPLCFVVGYVQPITQHFKSRTFPEAPLQSTHTKRNDFHFKGKPSYARAKSTPFPVSKDEWDTKEDTGKSMKNALYILQYSKRHLSGRNNIEQWKNQARSLSCYWVTLVWRHQSVSQLLT